jgi:hypothetical protein
MDRVLAWWETGEAPCDTDFAATLCEGERAQVLSLSVPHRGGGVAACGAGRPRILRNASAVGITRTFAAAGVAAGDQSQVHRDKTYSNLLHDMTSASR